MGKLSQNLLKTKVTVLICYDVSLRVCDDFPSIRKLALHLADKEILYCILYLSCNKFLYDL